METTKTHKMMRTRSIKLDFDVTEADASDATVETETASLCSNESSHYSTRETLRKVRFVEKAENSIKIVERFEDPSLWWKRGEIKAMRGACLLTAYANRDCQSIYAKATMRFVNEDLKGDKQRGRDLLEQMSVCSHLRGLENYLLPDLAQMLKSQVSRVLVEQKKTTNPKMLRAAARKGSRPSRKLARQLASHDVVEAFRCSLSSWKEDPIVFLD